MKTNKNQFKISNILVIGCGGAGLRAAIEAKNAGLDVIVLGKRPRTDAHTVLAAGGINAALGNLSSTVRLLNPTYSESFEEVDGSLLVFTDLNSEVNNVAKKADDEYGSMAGIDHYNEYDRSIDPFIAKLQSEISR